MTARPKVGDLFLIPLGDGRASLGQVVARHRSAGFLLAAYDRVVDAGSPIAELSSLEGETLILLAPSLGGKFQPGHWSVVGRADVPSHVPMPVYKLADRVPDRHVVLDYTGTKERLASPEEVETLPYRVVVAPVRLEKAVRAFYGLQPWVSDYDELLPQNQSHLIDFFPQQ